MTGAPDHRSEVNDCGWIPSNRKQSQRMKKHVTRYSIRRSQRIFRVGECRIAVDAITANELERFDPSTVANVRDLLSACGNQKKVPRGVKKGYWNTVVLWWDKFELEVFDDRVEVYRFHDQGTEIWHEEHTPEEPFSSRFLAELDTLAS